MRPLSVSSSKAMLPVLGDPLLAYMLRDLSSSGFSRAVLTFPGRNDDIRLYFGNGSDVGMSLEYLGPQKWTGTAGSAASWLESAHRDPETPLLVIYGDSLLQMDFGKLVDFHQSTEASMTLACHRPKLEAFLFEDGKPDSPRTNFGVADLRRDGRVIHFEEKPFLHTVPASFAHPVASAAVYVISPAALRRVPRPDRPNFDFAYDVIPSLLAAGEKIVGVDIAPGYRVDLGTLDHYLSFNLAALRGDVPLDIRCPESGVGVFVRDGAKIHTEAVLIPPVFVDSGAILTQGSIVECAIIGAGTEVHPGAKVVCSVILFGAWQKLPTRAFQK